MQSAETVIGVLRERATNHDHDIVTGEPGDRKRSRRVREGGVEKDPQGTSPTSYLGTLPSGRDCAAMDPGRVRDAMRTGERATRCAVLYARSRTHARRRGGEALKRLQAGEWPAPSTVIDLYGAWAAVVADAFDGA